MNARNGNPWRPVADEINRMLAHMDPGNRLSADAPGTLVSADTEQVYVELDLPGANPASLEVEAEKDMIHVRGSRREAAASREGQCVRKERPSGEFAFRVAVPEEAQTDASQASYRNGVLTLTFPKRRAQEPRKIDVEVT